MWWFARQEEPPPGLPDGTYALVKLEEGWFFVRTWGMRTRGERYREGPFPERDDARWWAWKDAWSRGVVAKPDGAP